ncbi:hypothetical protein ACF09Y_22555 [Streptomyces massasporeus]|uniref:hypothetical protein n=1 Tax=Streptomyces massasporeus TaxID=67324 RepID=UPI0036FDDA9A
MIRGRGKHSGRELVRRLRSELRGCERQNALLQVRLRRTQQDLKTQTVQREMADALVLQQATALQEKNARIAQLEHRLRVSGEDTVETPLPVASRQTAA